MSEFAFDWSTLAFGSAKELRALKATFIAAPREISTVRFTQLVKEYLPKGHVVLGVAKEPYVLGLEGQPQFRMQRLAPLQKIISLVNARSPHKIHIMEYSQRDTKHVLAKGKFRKVVLANGSWHLAFHNTQSYYVLANKRIDYELVSPFANEAEAQAYEKKLWPEITATLWPSEPQGTFTEQEMMSFAGDIAKLSYDYSFQTGAVLGKKMPSGKYKFIAASFNKVVPFQTFALHYGNARETHFSPPGDLNYYDTVHAETMLIIKAAQEGLDMRGNTVFINLLPCPLCARMFTATDIAELVYSRDHSDGYAVAMLEHAGKQVRRLAEML